MIKKLPDSGPTQDLVNKINEIIEAINELQEALSNATKCK